MSTLREFFKQNEVKIGLDFTVVPPVYYSSLLEAVYHYFLTFRDKPDAYQYIDLLGDRKNKGFNSTGANENIMFALINFHRFFELLLKDILASIDPALALKSPSSESEVFEHITTKELPETLQTIEFASAIKRFKFAFKYYGKDDKVYQTVLSKFEFLNANQHTETLQLLAEWRNRITHNGLTIPNIFAFDFFVSQHILPIVDQVVHAQKDILKIYKPHFYKTKTGIHVMDGILSIKFSHHEFSDLKNKDIQKKYVQLGHLKEVGRTTYLEPVQDYLEPHYNGTKSRAVRMADSESEHTDFFHQKMKCPCCGVDSLVVYNKPYDNIFSGGISFNSWLKCFHCDYSLSDFTGDPSTFGICHDRVFPLVKHKP